MANTCEACKHWREDRTQQYWRSGDCDHPQRKMTFESLQVRPLTLSHHTCDKHEPAGIDKPTDTEGGCVMAGKTQSPWELACDWYTAGKAKAYLRERQPDGDVPEDVHSDEFAEWLTHQVRLAMSRGIMIGEQRQADIDKPDDTEGNQK